MAVIRLPMPSPGHATSFVTAAMDLWLVRGTKKSGGRGDRPAPAARKYGLTVVRNRARGDCGFEAYVDAKLAPQGVDDAALRGLVAEEMLKNPEAYAHAIPGCSTSVFDKADGRQLMELVIDAPYKRYVATQVAPPGKYITNHGWAALRKLFPNSKFVFLSLSESGDTLVRRYFGNDDVVWVSNAVTPGDMASLPEDTKVFFFYPPVGPQDQGGHFEFALRAAVPASPHG